MALISNGTTIASGGSLSVSTTPTTSQVLTATASASAGAVGTYAHIYWGDGSSQGFGATTSNPYVTNNGTWYTNTTGGTWRTMYHHQADAAARKAGVALRIS